MSLIPEIYGNIKSIVHFRKQGYVWQQKYEPNVPKVGELKDAIQTYLIAEA